MAGDGRMVALFGATGYTGRLIAAELHRHRVPLLLAGRDPTRLAAVAARCGGADVLVAQVSDQASLDALARRASVLINTVGPFIDFGEPVVRAAIAAGAHYVDTTGEQPFVQAMLVHDTWAKTQEVMVVPAMAFEIALGDCGAVLAAAELDAVERIAITYVTRFHTSQGTRRTALRMLAQGGLAYVDGGWVEEPPGRHRIALALPPPVGAVTAVSFPGAEVLTIPRHVAAREVRTYLGVPGLAARALVVGAPLVRAFARSPLATVAERLLGQGTEGPDEATRRRDVFHVVIDAHGRRRGRPAGARVVVRGHDPYGLTAALCRLAAVRLLSGTARPAGVLSPAMAFTPRRVLDDLAADGVSYETMPLPVAADA